jgi:NADH-quinone oxidoreductase subunit H
MVEFLEGLHPALLALVRVLLFVGPVLLLVPGLIWWERRLLGWMQDRVGPNRTGTFSRNFPVRFLRGRRTFGLLQPIADGVKLFFKEDVTPAAVDRKIYFVAPMIALFPAFALGGTLPWGPPEGLWGLLTPIADLEIGLLYILAISSLGVYGVVLAGYASNNKYSLLGGLRASAQLISYELAMGVSLACMVMAVGSMRMTEVVAAQEAALWGVVPWIQNWFLFTPYGFVSFVVFLICVVAETNRAPFDLPEAENEIIAGYHTEYSSMKFAMFFMGEYAAMFVFGGVLATVFLGGYNLLPFRWEQLATDVPALSGLFAALGSLNYWLAPLGFLAKCALAMTFFIWLRATLPRLRYDQLMGLGWKVLLPVAVANFIVVAIWILCTELYGPVGGLASVAAAAVVLLVLYLNVMAATRRTVGLEMRTIDLVDPAADSRGAEKTAETGRLGVN